MLKKLLLVFFGLSYVMSSILSSNHKFLHHRHLTTKQQAIGQQQSDHHISMEGSSNAAMEKECDTDIGIGCNECNQSDHCCAGPGGCLSHCMISLSFYDIKDYNKSVYDEIITRNSIILPKDWISDYTLYKDNKLKKNNLYISYQESQFPPYRVGIIQLII